MPATYMRRLITRKQMGNAIYRKIIYCCILFLSTIVTFLLVHNLPTNKQTGFSAAKTFLYLIQGESCLPDHLKSAEIFYSICDCDIIVFGFKEKCTTGKHREQIEYIHKKNTTWNSGRNYLYEYAMSKNTKYLYYIFMDDDIEFKPNADTSTAIISRGFWLSFQDFLLEYNPAIGATAYCNSADYKSYCVDRQKNGTDIFGLNDVIFDAAMNAYHREAISYVLPYRYEGEETSWWYSQIYVGYLARHYFHDHILIYGNINAVNVKHREYPRNMPDEKGFLKMEAEVDSLIKARNKPIPQWKGKKPSERAQGKLCKC